MSSATYERIVSQHLRGRHLGDLVWRYGAFVMTLLTLGVAAIMVPAFFGAGNLRTVAIQASVLGVATLGQTVVLLGKGLDMSVTAVIAWCGVLLIAPTTSSLLAFLVVGGLLALVVGLVNGWLVVGRRVPAFVATFAVLIVFQGARLAYTRGQASGSAPKWLTDFATSSFVGLPGPVLLWLALTVVLGLALGRTTWGRWVYAIGANDNAAAHIGVPTSAVRVSTYVVCALFAIAAGLLLSGYLGYVDNNLGAGYNLRSVASAIIGGVAFTGGRGGVVGAAIGAVLLTILANLLVVAGLSIFWQQIMQGAVLILAVALQAIYDRGERSS